MYTGEKRDRSKVALIRSAPKALIVSIDSVRIDEKYIAKTDWRNAMSSPGPWYEVLPGTHSISVDYGGFYRHVNPSHMYMLYTSVEILGSHLRGPFMKGDGASIELVRMKSDSSETIEIEAEAGHRYEIRVELAHNPLRPDRKPHLPRLIAPADWRYFIVDVIEEDQPRFLPVPRSDQLVITDFPWRSYSVDLDAPPDTAENSVLARAIATGDADFVEMVLATEETDIVDEGNAWGMTALHLAAENGHIDMVKTLLNHDAEVDAKNEMGATPLFYAAGNGYPDVVKLLLASGANVHICQKNKWTPLHHAVQGGHYEVVMALLKAGARVNAGTDLGLSPLIIAANEDYPNITTILLNHGANPNYQDKDGWSPLHYAAQCGDTEIIRMLIDAVADIDAQSSTQCTPLHNAAVAGNYDAVEMLLNNGASPNIASNGGWTPLHMAAVSGDARMGKLLIKKGADVDARLDTGLTAYEIAIEKRHLAFITMLGYKE